jgi:hypothetical protein
MITIDTITNPPLSVAHGIAIAGTALLALLRLWPQLDLKQCRNGSAFSAQLSHFEFRAPAQQFSCEKKARERMPNPCCAFSDSSCTIRTLSWEY